MKESKLEKEFATQVARYQLPAPEREFVFGNEAFGRKWRFDFYWRPYRLAVELHGLVHNGVGGHQTIPGMTRDADKRNAAILLDLHVLVFFQGHVAHKTNGAIHMTMRALASRGWRGPGT